MAIVNDLKSMKIGDKIPCKYSATSGQVGIFSELGTSIAAEIPVASSATPDGLFYFIHAGYDHLGRMKLIADRNIQHSISWDTLNSAGIVSELPIDLGIGNSFNTSIRLLTGGVSSTDKDNEWDKIIVESNLGGTITPGDNNIWNWKGIYSWNSTTPSGTNTSRVHRGSTVNAFSYSTTTTAVSNLGFRPVLLVETLISDLFLLKQGLEYFSIKPEYYNSITKKFNPLTLSGGAIPNGVDIEGLGFDNLNILLSQMTIENDTFKPIDLLENTFEIKHYSK